MSLARLRRWLGFEGRFEKRSNLARRCRPRMESLESRDLLSVSTSFVNDNWHFVTDVDGSNDLSYLDEIRNDNDPINTGGVTAFYGLNGFGTVTTGAETGSLAAYDNINDAIAGTVAGGAVNVLEGTYSELVTVNKTVALLGAQAGVDARTRTAVPESVVNGNAGSTSFHVTADGATIDGFTVQGATSPNLFGFGILLGAGTSGSQVINNVVQDNIVGLSLANDSAADQTVIRHNLFRNNDQPGPSSGTGIYSDEFNAGGALTNVLIEENTFHSHGGSGAAINLSSTSAGSQTDITITGNTFTDNSRALVAFNLVDSEFSDNTVSGSTLTGSADLRLFDGVSNVTFSGNTLTGTGADLRGVRVTTIGVPGGAPTGLVFSGNTISGYGNAGIEVGAGDASVTGNDIFDNPTGVLVTGGAILTDLSANDFRGLLTGLNGAGDADDNGTDLQIASTAGAITIGAANKFAGNTFYIDNLTTQSFDLSANGTTFDFTDNFRIEDRMHHRVDTDLAVTNGLVTWVADNVYVTDGGTDHSIQRGIDAATAGDTVNVETGTYTDGADATGNSVTLSAGAGPGLVNLTGDLILDSDDTFAVDVNSSTPGTGFDQWVITGNVTLDDAELTAVGTKTSQPGAVLVLIQNDGTDAVNDTFLNQPEMSTVVINGVTYRISYKYNAEAGTFGDGNDVALIQTPVLLGSKVTAITDKQTAMPFDTFTIVEDPAATVTVTVQQNHLFNGTFTNTGGFTFEGNGRYTFTGSAAAAQAAIQTMVYKPNENQRAPGTTPLRNTFRVTVDNGSTVAVDNGTRVDVTSVNDAPVLGGAQTDQPITDTQTVKPFANFTIVDVDHPRQTQQVTVQQNHLFNGSFTSASLAESGFVSQGNGRYTFMGTADQSEAAIRKLVWVPVDRAPGAVVRTTFTVSVFDGFVTSRNSATSVRVTS